MFYLGWWYTYPSEKYELVGIIIPNLWKNVPNHQPVMDVYGGYELLMRFDQLTTGGTQFASHYGGYEPIVGINYWGIPL